MPFLCASFIYYWPILPILFKNTSKYFIQRQLRRKWLPILRSQRLMFNCSTAQISTHAGSNSFKPMAPFFLNPISFWVSQNDVILPQSHLPPCTCLLLTKCKPCILFLKMIYVYTEQWTTFMQILKFISNRHSSLKDLHLTTTMKWSVWPIRPQTLLPGVSNSIITW